MLNLAKSRNPAKNFAGPNLAIFVKKNDWLPDQLEVRAKSSTFLCLSTFIISTLVVLTYLAAEQN